MLMRLYPLTGSGMAWGCEGVAVDGEDGGGSSGTMAERRDGSRSYSCIL